eukprot:scaffold1042_cov401-Prasinococcus_capsulatus_cf.AAC.51
MLSCVWRIPMTGDRQQTPVVCRPQTAFLTDMAREEACLAQVDRAHAYEWVPEACSLDRFEPQLFMETVRGKKIVFAGDSLVDNSYTSLQCQLTPFLSTPYDGDWGQPFWSMYSQAYNTSFIFVRDEWLLKREHFENENEEGEYLGHLRACRPLVFSSLDATMVSDT